MKSSRGGPGSAIAVRPDSNPEIDEAAEARHWWRRYKNAPLADAVGQVTLPQALHDVSVMALAHMARRLDTPSTPAHVKDRIALQLGPKVFIHAHGHTVAPDQTAKDLLDAYEPPTEPRKLDS